MSLHMNEQLQPSTTSLGTYIHMYIHTYIKLHSCRLLVEHNWVVSAQVLNMVRYRDIIIHNSHTIFVDKMTQGNTAP